jgi:hypothetical protein
LYNYGTNHRGIEERMQSAKSKLAQLDTIINQKQSETGNLYQSRIQIGLALISLIQLYGVIKELFPLTYIDESGKTVISSNGMSSLGWGTLSAITVFALILFWSWYSKTREQEWFFVSKKKKKKRNRPKDENN